MANDNPQIIVDMDRPRQLKYPLSTKAKIERLVHMEDVMAAREAGVQAPPTIIPINRIINDRFNFSVNRFKILLYNGLLYDDPKLKPEQLDEIYEAYLQKFVSTEEEGAYLHMFYEMARAINLALGPPKEAPKKPPEKSSPGSE